ncbi:MAG: bifunctional heptose 7-phosphate kinase/heptose 1-phosphate adenyltransferase [Chloroflexota bacterium]
MSARLRDLVAGFKGKRVLVLGDMVADEYWFGEPTGRVSREAPIPIFRELSREVRPGGATNLAYNAHTLGAEVYLAGVTGDDASGNTLRHMLSAQGLNVDGLVVAEGRPTYTKVRIVAGSSQEMPQQVARIDRFADGQLDASVTARISDYARDQLPRIDALLFSDYEIAGDRNGVISQRIIDACLPEAAARGVVTCADSHGDLLRFRGVTVATPNQPEAEATLHRRFETQADLEAAGQELLRALLARCVLVTRGSAGMSLFDADGGIHHLPVSNLTEVRDVTGAGDTVAAAFVLGLLAGGSMLQAAQLGNVAAGLVVRKVGAATTTPQELLAALAELP